jgi:hypothetical protein
MAFFKFNLTGSHVLELLLAGAYVLFKFLKGRPLVLARAYLGAPKLLAGLDSPSIRHVTPTVACCVL